MMGGAPRQGVCRASGRADNKTCGELCKSEMNVSQPSKFAQEWGFPFALAREGFLLIPSLFDLAGSLSGRSRSLSISTSTHTLAARAYCSSTQREGSSVPRHVPIGNKK